MNASEITRKAKELFGEERSVKRLDGWFYVKEIRQAHENETLGMPPAEAAGYLLKETVKNLPLYVSPNAVFAGTQRDAFARSYALINPSFRVETFSGYCDPSAVFNDVEPNTEISAARIERVKIKDGSSAYSRALKKTYSECEQYTCEAAFFIEQVTGHVIPDVRPLLRNGTRGILKQLKDKTPRNDKQKAQYRAMEYSLEALEILAERYRKTAELQLTGASVERASEITNITGALDSAVKYGAKDLFEAIQCFILIWQTMCLEQSPNPYAFSVGNADRIFEPYRAAGNVSREETAALLKHLLVFFNVGDRSWAISQNIIVGGKDADGKDLTNETSFAFLDAYFDMNLPQPILSVKLHKNTPEILYRELGKFLFSPGALTPSFFNDDAMFEVLTKSGIDKSDLADYSVAGCQEPLIMGKDNGNTTNSWLNLGKILELTLSNGVSTVTGKRILPEKNYSDGKYILRNIRELFYENVRFFAHKMAEAANGATESLSLLPVPFLSLMMGGSDSGYDMRDVLNQGTKYNGSGCLIHGNTTVSDSFVAIDRFVEERPDECDKLISALAGNFKDNEELRGFLLGCPKFGNNERVADEEAAEITRRVADIVANERNSLGNRFRPDFSTPSTHLTYGYWVGALPDGRLSREMLNYGVDPLAGNAHDGMGFRMLSAFKLPYEKMSGGYASHFGIDPNYFRAATAEEKGVEFYNVVIKQLFFNAANADRISPFYLYVNITTPEILRKVLDDPKKYAPSGVYIMRIHGTFVNFLDLSPAIQEDIIRRLDLKSTACASC